MKITGFYVSNRRDRRRMAKGKSLEQSIMIFVAPLYDGDETANPYGVIAVISPISDRIWRAFQPLNDLIVGIAYPLAYISIAAGICLIIIGQRHHGQRMIKYAVVGYLAMQFLPGIMKIIAEVGAALASP